MEMRATEPLVTDHLVACGMRLARPHTGFVLSGRQAYGFDVRGLARRELWDMLDGRTSRDELHRLAIRRRRAGVLMPAEDGWTREIMDPSAAAREFWADRSGPWQPDWSDEHAALVARRSAQLAGARGPAAVALAISGAVCGKDSRHAGPRAHGVISTVRFPICERFAPVGDLLGDGTQVVGCARCGSWQLAL
jgi:hypothetical protein